MVAPRIVTFLTDFGLRDHFVAAMKGVMLSINPELNFVDITHLIPAQDVRSGAFTLGQVYRYYPLRTIHVAVVDPGVGTSRKPIVVTAGDQFFVAPDNGLLSYVFENESDAIAYEITAEHYFRKPISATFHGRDILAPIGAWISREVNVQKMGPVLENPVRFTIPTLKRVRDSLIQATILAVDHFGNLVTNLTTEDVPAYSASGTRPCRILAGQREITSFCRTFADANSGELCVVPGSTGYLELVVRNGSAASLLNLSPGAMIGVVLGAASQTEESKQ